jgi:peptidase M50B-like protein
VSLTQVPLSGAAAAVVGLAALAGVATDVGWRLIRHGTVMAHEGAHAVTGSLLFRGVRGIELNSDATGGTLMNSGGCLGSILVSLVGYAGPSLFGLGAARLIQLRHSAAVLWVTLFLLGALLFVLNRSFGLVTVILLGGLLYVVVRYTPVGTQIVGAYGISWLLLLSGVRRVLEVGVLSSDGASLSRLTHLPRLFWFLIWLAATLAALAAGGKMLVMPT